MNLSIERTNFVVTLNELVAQTLMIPLSVIMRQVLVNGVSKRAFAEEDHALPALGLQGAKEPLDVSVQIWTLDRQANGIDARVDEQVSERRRKCSVAIHDQKTLALRKPSKAVSSRAACFIQDSWGGIV